jgi:hypothetical protein
VFNKAFTHVFITANEKSFRKHVLCLKTESIQKAVSGVVNIVAVNQSKGENCHGHFYTIS